MRQGLEARALRVEGNRTTICLEPEIWLAIETVAAMNNDHWTTWLYYALDHKPDGMSRSAWTRIAVVNELMAKLAAAEADFTEDMV